MSTTGLHHLNPVSMKLFKKVNNIFIILWHGKTFYDMIGKTFYEEKNFTYCAKELHL